MNELEFLKSIEWGLNMIYPSLPLKPESVRVKMRTLMFDIRERVKMLEKDERSEEK